MTSQNKFISQIIKMALIEDKVTRDITTLSLADLNRIVLATVTAKESGIISGLDVFSKTFLAVDPTLQIVHPKGDGDRVKPGDTVAKLKGSITSILKAERTALNFMQRLCGIATTTNRYVKKLKGTSVKLLDTRKTTPGMRWLEKKAVRDGGGKNHRMDLEDMAMIKDNHIRMAGTIAAAVKRVRQQYPKKKIEVEVTSLKELKRIQDLDVDIIMLDNFSIPMIEEAVLMKPAGVKFEVSGNITLDNILEKALPGVDYISVGALTHSFKCLDLSLNIGDA